MSQNPLIMHNAQVIVNTLLDTETFATCGFNIHYG